MRTEAERTASLVTFIKANAPKLTAIAHEAKACGMTAHDLMPYFRSEVPAQDEPLLEHALDALMAQDE